jgi:hypothetical protein
LEIVCALNTRFTFVKLFAIRFVVLIFPAFNVFTVLFVTTRFVVLELVVKLFCTDKLVVESVPKVLFMLLRLDTDNPVVLKDTVVMLFTFKFVILEFVAKNDPIVL